MKKFLKVIKTLVPILVVASAFAQISPETECTSLEGIFNEHPEYEAELLEYGNSPYALVPYRTMVDTFWLEEGVRPDLVLPPSAQMPYAMAFFTNQFGTINIIHNYATSNWCGFHISIRGQTRGAN